jgi:hypothetical protein
LGTRSKNPPLPIIIIAEPEAGWRLKNFPMTRLSSTYTRQGVELSRQGIVFGQNDQTDTQSAEGRRVFPDSLLRALTEQTARRYCLTTRTAPDLNISTLDLPPWSGPYSQDPILLSTDSIPCSPKKHHACRQYHRTSTVSLCGDELQCGPSMARTNAHAPHNHHAGQHSARMAAMIGHPVRHSELRIAPGRTGTGCAFPGLHPNTLPNAFTDPVYD